MTTQSPILFTPGPVRIPPAVAAALADPPCNYHRQDGFRAMLETTESDLKSLIGIAEPGAFFATQITSTGTGANEACLLAVAGLGRGAILSNGWFGGRLADQAAQNQLDHVVLEFPHDRPIDPDDLAAALDRHGDLRWVFYVSHETRVGLPNPMVEIGRVCKDRGIMIAADAISSAYAYPIEIEGAHVDLAIASSAKALMAAPGIGIVFVRRSAADQLRGASSRGYYLDLIAEYDKQRTDLQPRFAQPVALHAAVNAACAHLKRVGIGAHMSRIESQLEAVRLHLESLDVPPLAEHANRSGVVTNFRLPHGIRYPDLARRVIERGYYVLYGVPGDDSHFQVSTMGDLRDEHVEGLNSVLSDILGR